MGEILFVVLKVFDDLASQCAIGYIEFDFTK